MINAYGVMGNRANANRGIGLRVAGEGVYPTSNKSLRDLRGTVNGFGILFLNYPIDTGKCGMVNFFIRFGTRNKEENQKWCLRRLL